MTAAILTPIGRSPHPDYVTSLIRTLGAFPDTQWLQVTGHANTPRVRNLLVHWALKNTDATDLVFIDDDIAWEPQAFERLLSHDVDIVAGAPARRSNDQSFCGRLDNPDVQKRHGELVSGQAATAFMRVTRKAYEHLAPTRRSFEYQDEADVKAFFDYDIGPTGAGQIGYVGEDFWFCDQANAQGLDVWIDPHIRLKHYHTMPLELCMADMMREESDDRHETDAARSNLVGYRPVHADHPSAA
jgi:hypothetical protein